MALIGFPLKVLTPIRKFLLEKEKKLKKRKKALVKEDPFSNPDRLKDNAASDTDAAERYGHDRVEAIRKEIDKTLINIRKALARIKLGRYGICEGCKKMIDTDRLAIDPTAAYCVKCEKKRSKTLS